jgi:transposase-like protein
MARKVNQALREEWRTRIEGQRQSGLTVAKFCHREGVSQATFYQWRRKLQARRPPQAKKAPVRQKKRARTNREENSPTTPPSLPFVQLPLSSGAACLWIEVVLAEGTVVRLPQQNLAALQTVLQTLGAAPASATGGVKYA